MRARVPWSTTLMLATSGTLMLVSSSSTCKAPRPARPSSTCEDIEKVVDEGARDCHCGGNAPVVNAFPINGLNTGGCKNREGIRLAPRSLKADKCPPGTSLAARGDALVGVDGNGEVVCRGENLAGATFDVVGKQTLRVKIAEVGETTDPESNVTLTKYKLEDPDGKALCSAEVAKSWRDKLELQAYEYPARLEGKLGDLELSEEDAVIVQGDLYTDQGNLLVPPGTDWFNIACAFDSLAKTERYDLHAPNDPESRQAALRMLTADYCGKQHFTVHGLMIGFRPTDDEAFFPSDPTEARWTSRGASCIDRTRLAHSGGVDVSPALPESCQPGGCQTDAQIIDAIRSECGWERVPSCQGAPGPRDHWVSRVVDR